MNLKNLGYVALITLGGLGCVGEQKKLEMESKVEQVKQDSIAALEREKTIEEQSQPQLKISDEFSPETRKLIETTIRDVLKRYQKVFGEYPHDALTISVCPENECREYKLPNGKSFVVNALAKRGGHIALPHNFSNPDIVEHEIFHTIPKNNLVPFLVNSSLPNGHTMRGCVGLFLALDNAEGKRIWFKHFEEFVCEYLATHLGDENPNDPISMPEYQVGCQFLLLLEQKIKITRVDMHTLLKSGDLGSFFDLVGIPRTEKGLNQFVEMMKHLALESQKLRGQNPQLLAQQAYDEFVQKGRLRY